MSAVAGPSRPSPFPPHLFRRDSFSPRHSSPAYYAGRFRSTSAYASSKDDHLRKRAEAHQRLKSTWEQIEAKYGSVRPEDDDEVNIITGVIIRSRGRLEQLDGRDFGEIDESEASTDEGGPDVSEFGEDEDELGAWDVRSGLDEQNGTPLEDEGMDEKGNEEDARLLRAFMLAEAERREAEPSIDSESDGSGSEAQAIDMSPRQHGTRIMVDSIAIDSEDEARSVLDELAEDDSDAEEAARTMPYFPDTRSMSPARSSKPKSPPPIGMTVSRMRIQLSEVSDLLPKRSRSLPSVLLRPVSTMTPRSIEGLFTPPPTSPASRGLHLTITSPHTEGAESTPEAETPEPEVMVTPSRPSGLDSKRYFPNLMRSRNGVTLRFCAICQAASGERREQAIWCKGRRSIRLCSFVSKYQVSDSESDDASPSRVSDPHVPARLPRRNQARIRPNKTPSTDRSKPSATSSHEDSDDVHRESSLDPGRYHAQATPHKRECTACLDSGGHRAACARYCRGRWSAKACTFSFDDAAPDTAEPSEIAADPEATLQSPGSKRYFETPSAKGRVCKACLAAGGDRSSKAEVCRGRHFKDMCTFEQEPLGDPPQFSRGAGHAAPDTAEPSPEVAADPEATLPSPGSERYFETPSAKGRVCKACLAAGGDRASKAEVCRGRHFKDMCTFEQEPLGDPPQFSRGAGHAAPDTAEPSPEVAADPEATLPSPGSERYFETPSAKGRVCKACLAAGGDRASKAEVCRGRHFKDMCTFEQEPLGDPPQTDGRHEQPHASPRTPQPRNPRDLLSPASEVRAEVQNRSKRSSVDRTIKRTPVAPYYPYIRLSRDQVTPVACKACRRVGGARAQKAGYCKGRRHPRLCTFENLAHAAEKPDRGRRSSPADATSPTLNLRVNPKRRRSNGSDADAHSDSDEAQPRKHAMEVSSAANIATFYPSPVSNSVPPSSPPTSTSPVTALASLFDDDIVSRPANATLTTPSRPTRLTPPPSSDDRSQSTPSDHLPPRLPRRSSLRPNDPNRPPSNKKLRFSLPPGTALWQDDLDDAIVPLHSQDSSDPSWSEDLSEPVYSHQDMMVRARDVGMSLSEHTGSLPPTLISAITGRAPTFTSRSNSTPPTSSPSTSSFSKKTSAELMLPPPVPVKSTPKRIMNTPPDDEPIVYKQLTPGFIRGRSMPRSLSAGLSTTGGSRKRQSTPAFIIRKSRTERDLARAARRLSDDAGMEWGMDEEVGEDLARTMREGSMVMYLQTS